jgi:hypothetical protein
MLVVAVVEQTTIPKVVQVDQVVVVMVPTQDKLEIMEQLILVVAVELQEQHPK